MAVRVTQRIVLVARQAASADRHALVTQRVALVAQSLNYVDLRATSAGTSSVTATLSVTGGERSWGNVT